MSLSIEIKFLNIEGKPYFEKTVASLEEAKRIYGALETYFMTPGNVEITVYSDTGEMLKQTGFLKP